MIVTTVSSSKNNLSVLSGLRINGCCQQNPLYSKKQTHYQCSSYLMSKLYFCSFFGHFTTSKSSTGPSCKDYLIQLAFLHHFNYQDQSSRPVEVLFEFFKLSKKGAGLHLF